MAKSIWRVKAEFFVALVELGELGLIFYSTLVVNMGFNNLDWYG